MTNKAKAAAPAKTVVLGYEEALTRFEAAKTARAQGLAEMTAKRDELAELRKALDKAVRGEDFDKAAELKARREELEALVSRDAKGKLEKAVHEAAEALAAVYLDNHPAHKLTTTVTVTRVAIVNPLTHNSDDVTYLESDQQVSLSLDGQSFDSEAWNIGEWAMSKGFLVYSNRVSVEV